MAEALPGTPLGRLVQDQILRSGMSTAANYRAARRARSRAEFVAKLGIVEEECDETLFWMQTITDTKLLPTPNVTSLHDEGEEILRIVVASIRSTKAGTETRKPEAGSAKPETGTETRKRS